MAAPEKIETQRLTLEPWSRAHAPLLAHLSALPEVMRWIGSGELWSQAKAEEISAAQSLHWASHGFGWRAAVEKGTVGQVGFVALNFVGEGTVGLDSTEYEIGWWLDPLAWGRGLAREGAQALRDEAFGRLSAPSVVARVQPGNGASIRVAEAIGLELDFETTGEAGEALRVLRLVRDG